MQPPATLPVVLSSLEGELNGADALLPMLTEYSRDDGLLPAWWAWKQDPLTEALEVERHPTLRLPAKCGLGEKTFPWSAEILADIPDGD